MRNKYFISDYFQKSKHFIFPLLTNKEQNGLLGTYLFAEYIREDIIDYYLLCEIEKDVELNEDLQKYLFTSYQTVDNTELHVFDLNNISLEVDKFLAGCYSEYTIDSKNKILKYHGWKPDVNTVKDTYKGDNIHLHFYVILYPNNFRAEYSNSLFNAKINGTELFNDENEVLNLVREMKELCPIYDIQRETFIKQIKQ